MNMELPEASSERRSSGILGACANCNVVAARVRGDINNFLFDFGCWIQGKGLALFLIGITALLGLCVGLKKTNIETNIGNLWVEDGGRLSRELDYLKHLKNEGIKSDNEVMIQVTKEKGDNVLRIQAVKEHLEMMKRITSKEVYVHQDFWKLSDICQKPSLGTIGDGNNVLERMLEQMTPCLIITPLDCFYEGSQIAGPTEPARIPALGNRKETWETLDPYGLIDELARANVSGLPEIELKKLFKEVGIEKGYLNKPCLDPFSSKCPPTSINYRSHKLPDVGEIMTSGCKGYATKLMDWSSEWLVGGQRRNKTQILRSGEALQSILMLVSADGLYEMHKGGKGMSVAQWSISRAEEVIKAWQREFTSVVNKNGYKNASLSTNMMAYSSTSFYDLIKNFSQPNLTKIITGYLVMLAYAFITLKRWSKAVHSYGAIGLIGVILVSASVAAAMGLSSLLKVSFNAASTQVLPFLALGLGVDDMFLVARTYVTVCESKQFDEHEIVGETLRNCGLSVTLTSFTNACAFAMASLIPVPALQTFSRQASLIVVVNWMTIMFLFTSTLGFDVKRVQAEKYDLFCCSGREIHSPSLPLRSGNILQDVAFINVEGLQGSSIYAGATLNAIMANQRSNKNRTPRAQHRRTQDQQNRPADQSSQADTSRPDATKKRWTWKYIVQHVSLSYFAEKYFGPFLQHMTTKIFVIFMLAIFLGVCAYGAFQVKDGLDVAEMIPRHKVEYAFVSARFQYFSFYRMHAVTKDSFDYANKQRLLHKYHQSFAKIDEIIREPNGNLPKFWLIYFRDWLLGLQNTFDIEWKEHRLSKSGWAVNASREAMLGYKLIVLSCDQHKPRNESRLLHGRLVDQYGIINPKCFYHYLTAWCNEDTLGYWMSQAGLKPSPPTWHHFSKQRFPPNSSVHLVPKADPLKISLLPFYLNNIRTTEDFVRIIKVIRQNCESFSKQGLPNFPTGLPFTYWEQYIYLHGYLWMAVGIVLAATLVVLSIALMNLWAALIVVAVLVMNTFELYGIMGLLALRLSAVPAVTLIISVGVGVEFTVHICLIFLSSKGDRNERMQNTINKMLAPIFDGAISTLIGIIVLAGSDFEFVVRYFFHLILAMILIGLANGLVLLPVLLSFIGPCCEITHRSVQPSTTGQDDVEQSSSQAYPRRPSRLSRGAGRSNQDIELSNLGHRSVHLTPKGERRGRQVTSRGWQKHTNNNTQRKPGNRTTDGQGRRIYRDPFGQVNTSNRRYCKYQHRNCTYDRRLRKCREQLTPVTECSTPDSSNGGPSSSTSTHSSRRSRPGTPIAGMAVPGMAIRMNTPVGLNRTDDYHGDSDREIDDQPDYMEDEQDLQDYDDDEDEGNLPGFIPESESNITTLKATATVTLELTSSSASQSYRVSRFGK